MFVGMFSVRKTAWKFILKWKSRGMSVSDSRERIRPFTGKVSKAGSLALVRRRLSAALTLTAFCNSLFVNFSYYKNSEIFQIRI